MPELCHNCGAELFAGQQYCRRCGVSVGAVPPQGEAPTQLFAQGPEATAEPAGGATGAAHVATAPLGAGQHTGLFAGGQPTSRQPPLAAFQQTSQLAPPAPPRRKGRGWLVVLVVFAVVILCGAAAAIAFIAGSNSGAGEPRKVVVVKSKGAGERPAGVPAPPAPPVPADLPERIKKAMESAGVPLPVDEADAEVGDDETVISESYDLGAGATVSVKGMSGDVSVVGTDDEGVEVKITKRGGSPQDRGGVPVLYSKTDDALSFITAAPGGRVKVSYEIQVPRGLRRLDLSVESGTVKVRDFRGAVEAEARNGALDIQTEGAAKGKVANGNVTIGYGVNAKSGPQEYTVTNGNAVAFFGAYPKAELKAETGNGAIEIDPTISAPSAEKRGGGMRAFGRMGEGGAPLSIKVVNGSIKLKN